jgi:amino acid adenylation domain-containing protein
MFVNTLVIRLKFEKDYTFRQILRLTNNTFVNALEHQDLPFENVVDLVSPVRSVSINPIFQVSFAWQNNLNIPLKIDGIKSKIITGKEGTSVFDLVLNLWENGDIIEGIIEFNTDLLKRDTIIRFKENFLTLIERLTKNYDAPLSSIPVISEEEIKLVLSFSNTTVPYPRDKTITQLFEEQVKIYPDKTAVVFKEESLTYKQLSQRTNQLARTLRDLGVKSDTPVGILVEKSIDMIVGILGILKAGGAYLPIDPEYPEQRINFIIKESGCKVLLTQHKYMEVPVKGANKLDLNSPDTYQKDKSNVESINSSSDLAYIMYTSGTTGVPKGSMIRHYSIVRLVRNTNYIELSSEDSILLTGAIVFDATTFEIWGALLNGGTLYIVEKEAILNLNVLGEELLKNDITILWLTSPLFTQISEVRTDIFSKLKYLLVGGDILSVPHINKVRKDNPRLKVINGYGPTENTTFSTTYLIERDFDHNIPIGKPISNSTAYIFDKNMNYQPISVIGELYVGGDGVSMGYLNRDDLNKKSFIDHPYIPGEKLYKTGDFARWLPDGNIEFHGRVDNQLKIRGFRVELEEIESVISEIEGIIETVIKPVKVEEGDYRLIAFLNTTDTFKKDAKEINRRIREKLPLYMIPSAYKFMHSLPKTINGKIDREALSFDIKELESKEIHNIESLTPTEKIIYNIWCVALKTKEILITDNFFEIGGNSLLAVSVLSKIETAFNLELGLRIFFDNPRIRDFSEFIDYSTNKLVKAKSEDKNEKTKSKIIRGSV